MARDTENELMDLWHLARTALAGTGKESSGYERALWASAQYAKAHPETSSLAAYKMLDRIRARWWR